MSKSWQKLLSLPLSHEKGCFLSQIDNLSSSDALSLSHLKRYPVILGLVNERTNLANEFGDKECWWLPEVTFEYLDSERMMPAIVKRLFSLLENFSNNEEAISNMCTPLMYQNLALSHNYFKSIDARLKMSVQVKNDTSRVCMTTIGHSAVPLDFVDFGKRHGNSKEPGVWVSKNTLTTLYHGSSLAFRIKRDGKFSWTESYPILSHEVLTKVILSAQFIKSNGEIEVLNEETERDLSVRVEMKEIQGRSQYKISDIDNARFSSNFIDEQDDLETDHQV